MQLVADKLAGAGGHWAGLVPADDLAALDSATLVRLLGKALQGTAAGVRPSRELFDVQHYGGAAGGFTFGICDFSRLREGNNTIQTPWVELGGFEWRFKVFPSGTHEAQGTHLSGRGGRASLGWG